MLDSLLGRAKLKADIEDLESELSDCEEELTALEEQLEATDRRRKEAIREAQEAQEERNRLEDRIEQLTDDLDRARGGSDVTLRGRERVGRGRMHHVLDLLDSVSAGDEGAYTAMLTDGDASALREHFGDRQALLTQAAPCLCLFDRHGLIEVALEPPIMPDPFEEWADTFQLQRSWFVPTGDFSFAVVRSDLFAHGRFDGESLSYIDGFESDVMGRHSKGGFSQARFERRREEQIEQHLKESTSRLEGATSNDHLILAGSQEALDRLEVSAHARVAVDASGPPSEALEEAFEEVWTTTLYRL